MSPFSKVQVCGIAIDAVRMPQAVGRLLEWAGQGGGCRYVVTPNVDHAVMYHERADLREAYADASLVLADGWPIVLASKLLGQRVPERVPGSDLAPALFKEASRRLQAGEATAPLRVYLLGAAPGVAEKAAQRIEARWPGAKVVGLYSPPLGFDKQPDENRLILDKIAAARPDVLVIGLGAPKQELWVRRFRGEIAAPVALCVGATIDFLAGEKRRAPRWVRRLGLEWFHRLASEPRRLFKRYARDAWIFPRLVWRQWRAERRLVAKPRAPVGG